MGVPTIGEPIRSTRAGTGFQELCPVFMREVVEDAIVENEREWSENAMQFREVANYELHFDTGCVAFGDRFFDRSGCEIDTSDLEAVLSEEDRVASGAAPEVDRTARLDASALHELDQLDTRPNIPWHRKAPVPRAVNPALHSKHLDELFAELRSVHRKAGRSFHPATEVQERDQRRRLVDPSLAPGGRTKSVEVSVIHCGRCLSELLRVGEKSASLGVELIGRPRGGELMV